MRTRILIPIVLSTLTLLVILQYLSRSAQALEVDEGWLTVAPGIEFQKFSLPDPNQVYVTRMDRTNPNVTLDSMISNGNLASGTERTSDMSARYEDTINFWGQSWGKRNDVVVAINGYYFGPTHEPPGVPWRGQIHSGWYDKRHDNNENGSGFVWKLDRTAFIGECVYHQPSEQLITFSGTTTTTLKITDINAPRGDDSLILYTPQYDDNTLTDGDGVEVLVEMTRPTLILPPSLALNLDMPALFEEWLYPSQFAGRDPASEAIGYIRKILDGQGSTAIPFDHVVLSATGLPRQKLLENFQVDMEIGISQAVNHLSDADCATPLVGKDWTKAYASIGGGFYFLEDGLINSFSGDPQATVHTARTAIAYSEDYIFFIVVDSFEYPADSGNTVSLGMNMAELGYFARETLGADFAISQDSGGSSTMVINGEVVNVPSHNPDSIIPIPCTLNVNALAGLDPASYLPLINNLQGTPGATATPSPTASPTPTITPTPTSGSCYKGEERYVANGMMMVVVDPMITSTLFIPGQAVTTTIDANLRLGPGTNYGVLAVIPAGSVGTIKDHLSGLDGVLATGSHWWKVNFGNGELGWISESVLIGSE